MQGDKIAGFTTAMMQDALCDELRNLFDGRKFNGQGGLKALKVFRQNLPIDTGLDEDTDTDAAASPYIVVLLEGGKIYNPKDAKVVSTTLTVCCYDEGNERDGFRDVQNILEAIEQHFCVKPFFGGAFTVLKGHEHYFEDALQMDDTWPYYFGALSFDVSVPVPVPEASLQEFV